MAHARKLIEAKQYVLNSDWGDAQPGAEAQNSFLERHDWADYANWHLGLTEGRRRDEGPIRVRLRRLPPDSSTGLIACVYRASEWRHKEVELAAHDLLQFLDKTSA